MNLSTFESAFEERASQASILSGKTCIDDGYPFRFCIRLTLSLSLSLSLIAVYMLHDIRLHLYNM